MKGRKILVVSLLKRVNQALILGGVMMGLNILALIIEFLVFPEKRTYFSSSYYLSVLPSYFIEFTLFSLLQVFVLKWDKWWKLFVLPTIIFFFQCLMSYYPDPMGNGLEAAYTGLTIWAKALDVVLQYLGIWQFTRLFCTAFLWLYQVAIIVLVNKVIRKHSSE